MQTAFGTALNQSAPQDLCLGMFESQGDKLLAVPIWHDPIKLGPPGQLGGFPII